MREKKIKYLTFGKFQKVLQISIDHEAKDDKQIRQNQIKSPKSKINTKFIEQRNIFLQNYTDNQKKLKEQFEQKILAILKEQKPKRIKQNTHKRTKYLQRYPDMNTQYQYPEIDDIRRGYIHSEIKQKSEYQLAITKSAVQDNIEQDDFKNSQANKVCYPKIPMPHLPKSPNSHQAHKLILNTLNIVPKSRDK